MATPLADRSEAELKTSTPAAAHCREEPGASRMVVTRRQRRAALSPAAFFPLEVLESIARAVGSRKDLGHMLIALGQRASSALQPDLADHIDELVRADLARPLATGQNEVVNGQSAQAASWSAPCRGLPIPSRRVT
jgi:hypothetical protein